MTVPEVEAGVATVVYGIGVVPAWTGVEVTGSGVAGLVAGMVRVEAGGWVSPVGPVQPDARMDNMTKAAKTDARNLNRTIDPPFLYIIRSPLLISCSCRLPGESDPEMPRYGGETTKNGGEKAEGSSPAGRIQ
jgi:hypothetical protein